MAIRKVTRTAPIPRGARVVVRDGHPFAVWTEDQPGGLPPKRRSAPLNDRKVRAHPPGTRIVVKSRRWYSCFRDHTGTWRSITASGDQTASEELDRKLGRLVACRSSGAVLDEELRAWLEEAPAPLRDKLRRMDLLNNRTELLLSPLTDHLADYREALLAKDDAPAHADLVRVRLEKLFAGCGFGHWRDLDAGELERWLAEHRRAGKMATRTSNHFVAAVRAFCNWMVDTERASSSPLKGLKCVPVSDEQERGVFTVDQVCRLLQATNGSPVVRKGMDGPRRAVLYRLAVESGLRAGAIRSLSAFRFRFKDDGGAIVTVEAGQQKNRRKHQVPLRPELAQEMRQLIARTPGGRPLFNIPRDIARVLKSDLEAAGLPTVDDNDRKLVFHSLRHTCGTWLNELGVDDAVVQLILGHRTRALTTDRYQHTRLERAAAAMAKLPEFALQGTGTEDAPPAAEGARRVIRYGRGKNVVRSGNLATRAGSPGQRNIARCEGHETLQKQGFDASDDSAEDDDDHPGGVAEWLKAPVLKTGRGLVSLVGSNPTPTVGLPCVSRARRGPYSRSDEGRVSLCRSEPAKSAWITGSTWPGRAVIVRSDVLHRRVGAGDMLYLTRFRCVRAALLCAGLLGATSILSGCHGALFGSGIGALAGQAIGGNTESTLAGALVGALIGAEAENPSYYYGHSPYAYYHYPNAHHRVHVYYGPYSSYGHHGHHPPHSHPPH